MTLQDEVATGCIHAYFDSGISARSHQEVEQHEISQNLGTVALGSKFFTQVLQGSSFDSALLQEGISEVRFDAWVVFASALSEGSDICILSFVPGISRLIDGSNIELSKTLLVD